MSDLLERLSLGPMVGDISLRHLLLSHEQTSCPEALSVLAPERILAAHREAVEAGAEVIRTNTFAGNFAALSICGMGDRANEINWGAVQIAREAVKGTHALVAGSIGPVPGGDESEALLKNQMGALLDGGVDFLVFEGFHDLEMLSSALHLKQELHHLPVVCFLPDSSRAPKSDLTRLARQGAEVLGISHALVASSNPFEGMDFPDQFLAVSQNAEELSEAGSFVKSCAQLAEQNVRLFFADSGIGLHDLQETASYFISQREKGR